MECLAKDYECDIMVLYSTALRFGSLVMSLLWAHNIWTRIVAQARMSDVSVDLSPTSRVENRGDTVNGVQFAITVRHAEIQYKDVFGALVSGAAPTTNVVLKDFNMTVQKGHIYGLLGASGCGKTSLLKAIMGRQELTAGEIRVLGHQPKTPQSGIPGTTVGYMPQELSLMDEFTIAESLYFYGRLAGMTADQIEARCDQLARLLELPKLNRLVETLSGGQRRRVSLSIALLHSPPILILDEPTVGVDPVLRESIWKYLTDFCNSNGNTVLITTHYTEEACNADTVGLMRHGKLMAEQNPRSLMKTLECNYLEEVLVKLCVLQSTKEGNPASIAKEAAEFPILPVEEDDDFQTLETNTRAKKGVPPITRVGVLTWKTGVSLLRHYWFLSVIIALPTVCTYLFCLSFGRTPTNLKVSVFNQETNCSSNRLIVPNISGYGNSTKCEMPSFLSCKVLELLENRSIKVVASQSESSAKYEVRKGCAWAAITFPKNFTSALIKRARHTSSLPANVIDMGTMQISMDQSDQIVSFIVQRQIMASFKQVLSDVSDVCRTFRHMKDAPIQLKHPIYGGPETSVLDSVVPGAVLSLCMVVPLAFTLSTLLPEKNAGTLERELIAGVRMGEVILSHFLVSLIPSSIIITLIIIIPYVIFGLVVKGSFWTIAVILIPASVSGMLFGMVLALFFDTVMMASLFALSIFFTCFFTSGTVWPIEGSSPYLRSVSWLLPTTLPTEALNHIILKGWSLYNMSVQYGLAASLLWNLAFFLLLVYL